jgi:hypothetical protein
MQRTRSAVVGVAVGVVALAGCSAVEEQASASDLKSTTCDELADEAVRISSESNDSSKLLKVREPAVVSDNRDTYKKPTGTGEALVLSCSGTGVWSDGGDNSKVVLKLTVDADGESYVAYEEQ